jgi:archaemetzincin
MPKVVLVQMSDFGPDVLNALKQAVEAAFSCPVELRPSIHDLAYAWDPIREQYDSPMLLERLKKVKHERGDKLLGIVDVDLFSPGFDYVYGEADVAEGIATLSLARAHPEFFGELPNRALFEERAVKEGVHELGHLFGLVHCRDKRCVMRFCPEPEYLDHKTRYVCQRCQGKLVVRG